MRRRSGFTLIEVLASAALVSVGLVACMSALGSMTHAEAIGREREAIANLAVEKYNEVVATTDLSQANQLNGDFTDRNDQDHTWTGVAAAVNTTSSSTVVNTTNAASGATVDSLSITVVSSSRPDLKYTVTGLVNIPPTTVTVPGAAGAAGGATGIAGAGAGGRAGG
jgi:prepilin-type N-terminal cleavage/methylation domain-containing protein